MWWFYGISSPVANIIASIELLPHYTIAFKPFFQFIILGVIPGTDIKLDIDGVTVLCTIMLLWYTYYKVIKQRNKDLINY